jgi:hypothetical protein
MATLVYEEIKGVEPPPPSIAIPEPNPGTSTSATPVYVEYEDIKPAVLHDGAESGNYHFTQCSAYGVPLETGNL